MDNLCCHKMIIVNSGPLCLASEESVDHLLLRCKVAHNIWMSVMGWFGLSWGFPYSLLEHFQLDVLKGSCYGGLLSLSSCGQSSRKGMHDALKANPQMWRPS